MRFLCSKAVFASRDPAGTAAPALVESFALTYERAMFYGASSLVSLQYWRGREKGLFPPLRLSTTVVTCSCAF
jgi:hypothetical protein